MKNGATPADVRSLSDLVSVDAVKQAMRYRLKQRNGQVTTFDKLIVNAAIQVARDWVGVDEDTLEEMREVQKKLGPNRLGLSSKSRAALRQFNDEDNQRLILNLPD